MEPLSKDFKEFIELLNENKVEYLLVGGYAVILYGSPRFTGDIDFWVKLEEKNIKKVIKVIKDFGLTSFDVSVDKLSQPNQIIQLGYSPYRIDIITSVSGVEFDDCKKNAKIFEIDDIQINVIGFEDLLVNKKASGRHKDLDDVSNLEK
ncbi:MAG: hypothetical protein FH748_01915 [Balneolaceae bacterium]|nr:hypothetical protein [Balneolaceae bacterium]